MSNSFPFQPGSAVFEAMERQRKQADLIKNALGPSFALQSAFKTLPTTLAAIGVAEKSGILKTAAMLRETRLGETMRAAEQLRMAKFPVLERFATTSWMSALQKTAIGINRDPSGVLATQRLLAGSAASDVLKLSRTFEANRPAIGNLIAMSRVGEQFRTLTDRMGPGLGILKIAAERARMIDALTLRASTEVIASSSAVIIAEQVLEAHRLIEAISHADDPAQSLDLFAAFLALMSAMFSAFGENTLKELRGIGAIKLIELFMLAVAIYQFAAPADMSPAEKKVHAEMQVDIETVQEKMDKIIAANEAADEAYVADLPRVELKKDAAIRRDPQGKAPVLMRGEAGMLLALKSREGKWCLVVYREPLTDQLSEGWVYAGAIAVLDDTVR